MGHKRLRPKVILAVLLLLFLIVIIALQQAIIPKADTIPTSSNNFPLPQAKMDLPVPKGNANQVRVKDGYAYVISGEGVDGLDIVDVRNPSNPILLSRGPTANTIYPDLPIAAGIKHGLAISGDYAYVSYTGAIVAINVRNKANPTIDGGINFGTIGPGALGVVVRAQSYTYLQADGNRLYAAVSNSVTNHLEGFFILDISNPATPTVLKRFDIAAQPLARLSNVTTIQGKKYIALLTDPNKWGNAVLGAGATRLIDITDAQNPQVVATLPAANTVYLTSERMYSVEGAQRDTVFVRNITNPAAPILLSQTGWAMEPQGIDLFEKKDSTTGNKRYLVIANRRSPGAKLLNGIDNEVTPGGTAPALFSGRTLTILNVENPNAMSSVATFGPQALFDLNDPALDYLSFFVSGNTVYGASYVYGLDILDLTNPSSPNRLNKVLLSGEGEQILTKGHYLFHSDLMSGTRIYDIANPDSPRQVAEIFTGVPHSIDGMALVGNMLYLALDGHFEMLTVDVTDPEHPVRKGTISLVRTEGNVKDTFKTNGVRADVNGLPYLVMYGIDIKQTFNADGSVASRHDSDGFVILDVSDPATPKLSPSVEASPSSGAGAFEAQLDGNTVWYGALRPVDNSGVTGYDVTNKMNPQLLVSLPGPNMGIHAMTLVKKQGKTYLFTATRADKIDTNATNYDAYDSAFGGLYVYDVTNRTQARVLKHILPNTSDTWTTAWSHHASWVMTMTAYNNILYLADYYAGVISLDITDPANPTTLPGFGPILAGSASTFPTGLAVTHDRLYVSRIYKLTSYTNPNPLPVVTIPNLTVTKSVVPSGTIASGTTLTYTLTYRNTSTGKATNAILSDTIPPHSSYVSGSATNNGQLQNGQIVWQLPDIAAGASGTVSFKVKAE